MRHTREERLAFALSHKEEWPGIKIHPSAEISKTCDIGGDGFGWVRNGPYLVKMPHAGGVIIEPAVQVREFVTIDRAVKGNTVIQEGTKIDHHCHIAHGAKIGQYNTLANGCIIEGSCEIGDCNTFGAGVIVQTKVKIGNNNIFGSGAVVTKDIGDNEVWVGCPAHAIDVISKYPKFSLGEWHPDKEFATYLTGFVDGEAYFAICETKGKDGKNGHLSYKFGIELSSKDKDLLETIRDFLGVGTIRERRRKTIINKLNAHHFTFDVASAEAIISRVIPFFDNFELKGFKKVQYKRWRESFIEYRNREGSRKKIDPARKLRDV